MNEEQQKLYDKLIAQIDYVMSLLDEEVLGLDGVEATRIETVDMIDLLVDSFEGE